MNGHPAIAKKPRKNAGDGQVKRLSTSPSWPAGARSEIRRTRTQPPTPTRFFSRGASSWASVASLDPLSCMTRVHATARSAFDGRLEPPRCAPRSTQRKRGRELTFSAPLFRASSEPYGCAGSKFGSLVKITLSILALVSPWANVSVCEPASRSQLRSTSFTEMRSQCHPDTVCIFQCSQA